MFATLQSSAQYDEDYKASSYDTETHHALGFVAGRTAGLGLAYRYNFDRLAFQAAFLPLKNKDRELYNVGLSIIYTLSKGSSASLIVMQSNMFLAENTFPITDSRGNVLKEGSKSSYWNHGLGIGASTEGNNAMKLHFTAGYGAFKNFDIIDFTVDAGIFYHF